MPRSSGQCTRAHIRYNTTCGDPPVRAGSPRPEPGVPTPPLSASSFSRPPVASCDTWVEWAVPANSTAECHNYLIFATGKAGNLGKIAPAKSAQVERATAARSHEASTGRCRIGGARDVTNLNARLICVVQTQAPVENHRWKTVDPGRILEERGID